MARGAAKATPKGGKKGKTGKAPAAEVKEPKAKKTTPVKAAPPAKSEGAASGGVVDRSRYAYESHKDVKTASGRASVDNGDPLAEKLRGKSSEDVIELVRVNGGEVPDKWKNLNPGLARMAAGNALRKLAKRTEGIKIDGKRMQLAA